MNDERPSYVPRTPVQISTAMAQVDSGTVMRTVVVLCDDGTVWRMDDHEDGVDRWYALPPIPNLTGYEAIP